MKRWPLLTTVLTLMAVATTTATPASSQVKDTLTVALVAQSPTLDPTRTLHMVLAGGHLFGGDYGVIARRILSEAQVAPEPSPPGTDVPSPGTGVPSPRSGVPSSRSGVP